MPPFCCRTQEPASVVLERAAKVVMKAVEAVNFILEWMERLDWIKVIDEWVCRKIDV